MPRKGTPLNESTHDLDTVDKCWSGPQGDGVMNHRRLGCASINTCIIQWVHVHKPAKICSLEWAASARIFWFPSGVGWTVDSSACRGICSRIAC